MRISDLRQPTTEDTMKTKIRTLTQSLLAALLLAGMAVGGEGVWIYAKAKLAQLLLEPGRALA